MDRQKFEDYVNNAFSKYFISSDEEGRIRLYGNEGSEQILYRLNVKTEKGDQQEYMPATFADNAVVNVFRRTLSELSEVCEKRGQPNRLVASRLNDRSLDVVLFDSGSQAMSILRVSYDSESGRNVYSASLELVDSMASAAPRRILKADGRTKVAPQSEKVIQHLQNPAKAKNKKSASRPIRLVPLESAPQSQWDDY